MTDLKLIAVAVIAILLALFARGAYDPIPRPQSLGDVKNYDDAVQSWQIPQRFPLPYGRYKKPLPPLDYSVLESQPWHFLRLKRWHYVSFNSDEWFCGMAIAHLGYVANGFLYLVNKQTGVKYETTSLSPLGYAVTAFNNTSVYGCSTWTSSSTSSFGVCSQDGIQHFTTTSMTLKDEKGNTIVVNIDVKFQVKETLSLLYPIGVSRPAYTDKAAGMTATGTLSIKGQDVKSITGLGALDWTYSLAAHVTKWKWTSLSTYVQKEGDSTTKYALGINLSDDVYNDDNGISQENGIWLDGVMHLVGHVKYTLPKNLETQEWKAETTNVKDRVQLSLTFQPHGIRSEKLNLGLIVSDFVQPYGEFNGYVSIDGVKYVIEKGYGVMENHYAKW